MAFPRRPAGRRGARAAPLATPEHRARAGGGGAGRGGRGEEAAARPPRRRLHRRVTWGARPAAVTWRGGLERREGRLGSCTVSTAPRLARSLPVAPPNGRRARAALTRPSPHSGGSAPRHVRRAGPASSSRCPPKAPARASRLPLSRWPGERGGGGRLTGTAPAGPADRRPGQKPRSFPLGGTRGRCLRACLRAVTRPAVPPRGTERKGLWERALSPRAQAAKFGTCETVDAFRRWAQRPPRERCEAAGHGGPGRNGLSPLRQCLSPCQSPPHSPQGTAALFRKSS